MSVCHSYSSIIKGNSALPPEDRLLKFLVDSNGDADETVQCANCDQESNKKVQLDRKEVFCFMVCIAVLLKKRDNPDEHECIHDTITEGF